MPPSPKLPTRAVVFDLDGLMFNTEELYDDVGRELLARRGLEFSAELKDEMMGRPGLVSLRIMIDWHGLSATPEQLARESDEIFVDLLDQRLAPMPGLFPLLEGLEAAQLPKAIATSSGRPFLERVLGAFDLLPRFSFTLTSEDVTQGKPHPEIYLSAARRFAVAPEELLVLEDSQNGCRAAIAAGTFAVAVPAGHSRRHDFSGASLVAESLADPRIYAALGLSPPLG